MARSSLLVGVFLVLCHARPSLAGEPNSHLRATTPQVQQTVDRAIKYLQTESADWLKTRKCAACHHVPLPLWALSEADRDGYAIDKKYLADTIESLLGNKEKLLSSRIFPNPAEPPDPRPQGRGLNMGLPMLAVTAHSLPMLTEGQKQSLKLIEEEIVAKQQADGAWEFFATLRRPPINESQTTDATWIIMALHGQPEPGTPKALAKAILWRDNALRDAAKRPELHQDKVLTLLLGARSGAPRKALQATIDDLLALQRKDGGWTQTVPEPRSDAFATGQTLYALSLAGITSERPEVRRGIDFLVATQKPDGSWPMISRSTPNGEPGSAKLLTPITCAASSWATLGLVRLMPVEAQEVPDGPKGTVARVISKLSTTYGGMVEYDHKTPGSPIVSIHLANSGATDADLAQMDLKALPRLRSLHVNQTRITDKTLPLVGELVHLEELNLMHAAVTDKGLDQLKGLTKLRLLALPGTVTDDGVAKFAGLTELRELALSSGQTDKALATVKRFVKLERLKLISTGYTDNGLANLAGLTELRELSVFQTGVTGTGLAHLKGCTHLKTLNLGFCPVTGEGLAQVRHLPSLQVLNLWGTKVGDADLKGLASCKELKTLSLQGTKVTDKGLDQLRNLEQLQDLNLGGTAVTDQGLETLKALKCLDRLGLGETGVTDKGLQILAGMPGLTYIYVWKTATSLDGLAKLRKALPKASIANY